MWLAAACAARVCCKNGAFESVSLHLKTKVKLMQLVVLAQQSILVHEEVSGDQVWAEGVISFHRHWRDPQFEFRTAACFFANCCVCARPISGMPTQHSLLAHVACPKTSKQFPPYPVERFRECKCVCSAWMTKSCGRCRRQTACRLLWHVMRDIRAWIDELRVFDDRSKFSSLADKLLEPRSSATAKVVLATRLVIPL